jgi:hypothetical protein
MVVAAMTKAGMQASNGLALVMSTRKKVRIL